MKPAAASPSPEPNGLVTFGGDYHRLESVFRPRSETLPAAKPRKGKKPKHRNGRRKKPR